jgi:hypothetical protein
MRTFVRSLAALTVAAGFVWLAACGSSPTGPKNVSLAGNYTLSTFMEGATSVPFDSGTLALTDTKYTVHIYSQFVPPPANADSGTYVATDSETFSETSNNPQVPQLSGTYTLDVNNLLTVTATVANIPVTQAWQKQ